MKLALFEVHNDTRLVLFCHRPGSVPMEGHASLHKNTLFFDEEFIRQVREAYNPFFQLALYIDYNSLPKLPDQYKDVVSVGRYPRQLIVDLFRRSLGVSTPVLRGADAQGTRLISPFCLLCIVLNP